LILLTTYYSGDQIKNNEIEGHVACMGERKGAYRLLERKPERRR